jgi:pantetheine-phosphate adenylyltransferase
MPQRTQHIIAVYPGSFDPVTHGHLDVIRRASRLFNELIIGVGRNPDKDELFTPQERLQLLKPHIKGLPNVRIEAYDGLTFDFVRKCGGRVLIRGIRDSSDLSGELLQANLNQAIGQVETIFLLTSDQHVLTSSTYVKQIYEMGGSDVERIERLVPRNVASALARKLGHASETR